MGENQLIGQSFLGGLELEQELASRRDVLIMLPGLTSAALYAVWGWEKKVTLFLELRNLGSGEAGDLLKQVQSSGLSLTELSVLERNRLEREVVRLVWVESKLST